jgi:hypothetical protein
MIMVFGSLVVDYRQGCFERPLCCRDAPAIRSTIFSTAFLRFG